MYRSPNNGFRDIAAQLRQEMLEHWQSGWQLPTFTELTGRFGTTPVTLQRAISLLAEQGFVVTKPRVGSFVAPKPPHTCQVGLVFPGHPGDIKPSWSRQYLANLMVAQELNNSQTDWRFRFYMDVGPHVGSKGLPKLTQDIQDRALAGLIWSYAPYDLEQAPLIRKPPLPMVHFNDKFVEKSSGLCIRAAGKPFLSAALDWAGKRGRKRVAVLATSKLSPLKLGKQFTESSITFRPEWVLPVDVYRLDWMPHVMAALFRDHPAGSPEMLIIADDHLVEPAVELLSSLAPCGLESLEIFANWNFPLPYNGKLPITRYGYDAPAWMAAALELVGACPHPQTMAKQPAAVVPLRLAEWNASAAREKPGCLHLIRQAREMLSECAVQQSVSS